MPSDRSSAHEPLDLLGGTIGSQTTLPIGRVLIGDTASATTFEVNFDHVVLDQERGDLGPDVTPPTVPGQPTGTSAPPSTIQLTWAGSTDDRLLETYEVYRDGEDSPIGGSFANETSFTDIGLTPGSTHTYTVVAVDHWGNRSAASPVSDPITVLAAPPPVFSDDFSSGPSRSGPRLLGSRSTTQSVGPQPRALKPRRTANVPSPTVILTLRR